MIVRLHKNPAGQTRQTALPVTFVNVPSVQACGVPVPDGHAYPMGHKSPIPRWTTDTEGDETSHPEAQKNPELQAPDGAVSPVDAQ